MIFSKDSLYFKCIFYTQKLRCILHGRFGYREEKKYINIEISSQNQLPNFNDGFIKPTLYNIFSFMMFNVFD